jgi:hypothetical protein
LTIAEIHRKSIFDGSEDLLTSDVFAAFRYLPADAGIIGFLRSVENVGALLPPPDQTSTCEYHFWPLGELCRREPDLLLELDIGGWLYHVVVEAKYMSLASDGEAAEVTHGGESFKIGNQLGDQCRDLLNGQYLVWRGSSRSAPKRLSSRPEDRFQLYITAHASRPDEELLRGLQAFPQASGRLFWANWCDVHDYLTLAAAQMQQFLYARIIDDVRALLEKKGFLSFQGMKAPPAIDMQGRDGAFWKG